MTQPKSKRVVTEQSLTDGPASTVVATSIAQQVGVQADDPATIIGDAVAAVAITNTMLFGG